MKTLHRKWVIFFIMCVIIMEIMSVGYTKVRAATVNDANVFLKQQTNYTCTLASAAMMLRRRAIVDGNTSWASITESSLRSTAWLERTGLMLCQVSKGKLKKILDLKEATKNFGGDICAIERMTSDKMILHLSREFDTVGCLGWTITYRYKHGKWQRGKTLVLMKNELWTARTKIVTYKSAGG